MKRKELRLIDEKVATWVMGYKNAKGFYPTTKKEDAEKVVKKMQENYVYDMKIFQTHDEEPAYGVGFSIKKDTERIFRLSLELAISQASLKRVYEESSINFH